MFTSCIEHLFYTAACQIVSAVWALKRTTALVVRTLRKQGASHRMERAASAILVIAYVLHASATRGTPLLAAQPYRRLQQAGSTIPASPYADPKVCLTDGVSVDVGGYPSSPFLPNVFTAPFANPPVKQPAAPTKADAHNNLFDVYDVDIQQVGLNLGVGCTQPTQLLGYDGLVPGPTFEARVGHQVLVRFTNSVPANSPQFPPFEPCDNNRTGRPFSIHKHGSSALAPWDGFAENEICHGESKDYLYPCNRAGTLWYHDHALDITSENAYNGLAGYFFVREQPERWGLEGIEEYQLILQDKVFDNLCQFFYDNLGVHNVSLYGDINLVSGIPFPYINAEPKWTRFRVLNGAVSRPFLVSIVDENLNQVSGNICQMLGSDGGYRRQPVSFPPDGLFLGVAERYDFVCDFTKLTPGKSYYIFNSFDVNRMKDVPFFCYSHLLAKINLAPTCTSRNCNITFQPPSADVATFLDRVVTPDEYQAALQQAQNQNCTRWFDFGRSNGQWVVNGQGWHDGRVAAADVGTNTWEVWCFKGHGGWFHPIHVHLVDFYILLRYQAGSFQVQEPYETFAPKDVVQLHPGAEVAVLVRWGPHRGEYMFHCHNLVHEDFAMMRTAKGNVLNGAMPRNSEFVSLTNLEFLSTSSTGVLYDQYNDPMFAGEVATTTPKPLLEKLDDYIALEPYRIFYPGDKDRSTLCDTSINKWLVFPDRCP